MKSIKAFIEAFLAALDLKAAEIRTGITLVESVAADATRTKLLAVTGNQHAVQKSLEMSIELAKNGINDPDLLEQMIRYWYRGQMFDITADDLMEIARTKLERGGE